MAFFESVPPITMCKLVFLMLVTCATTTGAVCEYHSRTDRQLYGSVYLTTYPGGEYRCQLTCWYSSRCASFNWNPSLKTCQLCHSSGKLEPWNLHVVPGVVYGEPIQCQGTTHACAGRACRDDEICTPTVRATQHMCLPIDSLQASTTVQGTSATTTQSIVTDASHLTSSTTTPSSTTTTSSTTTSSLTTTTSSTTFHSQSSTVAPTTTATTTTKAPPTSTTSPLTTTSVSYVAEGCFSQNNSDRLLPTDNDISSNSMTIPMCSAHCRTLNKPYIALHKGKDCSCGSSLDTAGHTLLADSECDKPCMGDSSTFCGATFKVSVFKNS